MFEQKAVREKIFELYPDVQKYAIDMTVRKDRVIGAENYLVTLSKDNRQTRFKLGLDDVQTCMDGNMCSLITMELSRFIRQFIDESYSSSDSG